MKKLILLSVLVLVTFTALAQRQMENLGRGVIALRTGTNSVYVGWRLLGTDPEDTRFNLYRVTGGVTTLVAANVTNSCNVVDNSAPKASAHSWFVQPVLNGVTQANSQAFTLAANSAVQQYLSIPLVPPPGGTAYDGVPYTYNANDCSAGDLDGDGEYEIILKWDPSNSKDNSQSGFTGDTYLDAYKLNGTRLWRINLGPNIRSGAHYMDFMVYDFDGDGKAEVMCRTAPGSLDGQTNYVGGAAKWQNANGTRPAFNNTDDYRFNNPNPNTTNGYVLHGPEFISVFNGLTGAELATTTFWPKRDQDNNNDNPSASRINAVWGDSYGNRLDRFLAGVAYCDGKRPSAIFCRGYYTRAYLAAWDWRGGTLSLRWTFNSDDGNPANLAYRGQGAHSLTIGDVDGDGKDEITYGAACIDDNGTGLYSTGLGHGDALHQSVMDPNRPGLDVWMVHESPSSYGPTGLEFRDAKNGSLIFGLDGQNADVGRGVAIDIDPRYPGYEMWGARGGLMSATGVQISSSRPSSMNFACWWDADLTREILDGTTISKWDWNTSTTSTLLSPAGIASNNSTKATPNLSADLFGDWREEVIWRTSDNLELRIFSTTVVATNRIYTLMHDPQYRCAIAWQNTGYNQPPHPGFFIGPGMYPPPLPPVSTAQLLWRGGSGNVWDDNTTANWTVNNLWTNTVSTNFTTGSSVLFDLSGSNNSAITLTGRLGPSQVTVFAPKDFNFAGDGRLVGAVKLFKTGPGKLTISNTNAYTGTTSVSGGSLFVEGTLSRSPVRIERRGVVEGAASFGGSGRLGAGLTLQRNCNLIVGSGTNSPGTLSVTNGVTELGGVANLFDLSIDPTGTVKTNDTVNIVGDLMVTGTNVIAITQLDGALGSGVYPLFTYSGTLTGGLSNFTLAGSFSQTVLLTNPPGKIALLAILPSSPPNTPTNLAAAALSSVQINLTWADASADENTFAIERSTNNASFTQIAVVAANITGYADIGLTSNTTYYYRLHATNLAGDSTNSLVASATTSATPPSLTWRGDGIANAWDIATTSNWLNGTNVTLYADTVFVTFNDRGSNSPAINLSATVMPGSLLFSNSTKSYTLGGSGGVAGATALVKSGSGSLTLNLTNTYTGGTIISNGTVIAGNPGANSAAFGSGPITFDGGLLEFTGWTGGTATDYGGNANALVILPGQTGTIRVPQRFLTPGLNGSLTGGGTLNLQVKYVRGEISGDWSSFTGKINVTYGSGGATVDDLRIKNNTGYPNARINLGPNVLMYVTYGAGLTLPIGEFSASPGSVVSANGGSGAGTQYPVTWRIGQLNTDATNAARFQGSITLIKEGVGRWALTGTNTYSGTTTVNGGNLWINGDNSGATGSVTVASSGLLGGTGSIGGATTVQNGGKLSPGMSIGKLTFTRSLTLAAASTSAFEISHSPLTNDVAKVQGALTSGGTLIVTDAGATPFATGDSFKLFDAASYSGSFNSFVLPTLPAGLDWNTNAINTNGTLAVIGVAAAPMFGSAVISGSDLVMTGSGGVANGNYYLLGTTNVAVPATDWLRLLTNQFDAAGNFSFTNTLDAGWPQGFYRLQLP